MQASEIDFELWAESKLWPDNTRYKSLSVQRIFELARITKARVAEVEVAALENAIVPERYARNMRTFSLPDQAALLKAHTGVVGLGGIAGRGPDAGCAAPVTTCFSTRRT